MALMQKKYASKEFLDGLKKLSIPKNNFPDFKLISRELFKASKWELVSVAGFLTEELFFDLNAQRKFPVTRPILSAVKQLVIFYISNVEYF